VIFAVLEIKKVSKLDASLCFYIRLGQRIRLDPDNEGSDRTDDQGISEDEFTLNIKGRAGDVSKNDCNKNDDVKKSFHESTI
jgi:hypothetical protein